MCYYSCSGCPLGTIRVECNMRELVRVSTEAVLWKMGPDDERWLAQVERVPDAADTYSVGMWPQGEPAAGPRSCCLIVVVDDGRPRVDTYIEPYTPAARLSHANCEALAKDAVREVIKNGWL
jgi:hypothetical protein